ncbi:MAG: serine hydroxymethyltransferase [Candidatus Eisenbacteria bacterium]|uniref:Serine hydroxymethyltransferase n=1 Tax=Eiseniibacteriota bacterium TaxID=2212470 RepID=A0A956M4X8_UNCEI|nr:serine hydroxymethyltransferase [Candidatus Eisenbacteria bacterium]
MLENMERVDPEIASAIRGELGRQRDGLELIASENFTHPAILEAAGSVLTNKYAEGYPEKRYYGGCGFVDQVESLAIARAKDLFGAAHANVQPHSGANANLTAYFSVLDPGDKILGLDLAHGGHLTHGLAVNFSGRFFQVIPYGVSRDTKQIDYDALEELATEHRPKLIVAGASAYARTLDFARFRQIADLVGAKLMVDMAHIAGLVAAGVHPSPVPHAHLVTSTTHKSLRGPRSGFILTDPEHAAGVDKTAFPGMQGGPLMHVIAGKAICFKLAGTDEFRRYQTQVLANAKALALTLLERGFDVVSGGTDTHLFLLDFTAKGFSGKKAERWLEEAGITVNKNTVPFDERSPFITSGIRIGTPAVTTRGMGETEMKQIGSWIADVLDAQGDETIGGTVRNQVRDLTQAFPLYPDLDR